MADTEGIVTTKCYIFIFLASLSFFNWCDAVLIQHDSQLTNRFSKFNAKYFKGHLFSLENENNIHKLRKRDASRDEECTSQESSFKTKLSSKIDQEHTFDNETKTAMALAWAGENDGNLIIVTSEEDKNKMGTTKTSSVFRSTDYGVTYTNITNKLGETAADVVIKKHNGLQRNPHTPKKVYLIGEGMYMFTTEDGGMSFNRTDLSFPISGEMIFHSSKNYSGYLMATNAHKDLYVSKDNGRLWRKVDIIDTQTGEKKVVDKVMWGIIPDKDQGDVVNADTGDTFYFTYGSPQIADPILKHFFGFSYTAEYTLAKSMDAGAHYSDLLKRVVSFERQGKFLYVSQIKNEGDNYGWRHLMISIDGGKIFKEAQLPTIEPGRFYSVMDIEDNMIFMHVDNKEDTGHGTLYTSANQGIVYSISLMRHLYPNYGEIHDFYKVKSMRGVYITSQMSDDDSIHSMITYNRGATWQKIPRPDGVSCKDESKECFLQLHGMYSMRRGIKSILPASEATAIGLVIAHGHVADALQKTEPDVFITRNGGYTWNLALKGPHHYVIGDHGGLLVAVSLSEPSPQIVKFSLDEGRCWHEYKFTDKILNFTGLLTEPEGKSSVFMLWGYVYETKKWEVHVIDFTDIISRNCGNDDYEAWKAHSSQRAGEGTAVRGCLLGIKETFMRLKKDSWCYNGYDHEVKNTTEQCMCTREDYECDYAYYRPGGSDNCVKETDFNGPEVDICLHGHDEKIISLGYRKIPSDKCIGGFQPKSKTVDLNKVCDEFGKQIVEIDEGIPEITQNSFSHDIKILAGVIILAVLILACVMGGYFVKKFILLRRHKTEYRYSMLNQNEQQNLMGDDDDEDQGNLERDLDKALSSSVRYDDSEEELNTSVRPSTARQSGVLKKFSRTTPKATKPSVAYNEKKANNPFGSYHDDSDDDMLS